MNLLSIENLAKNYGERVLFEQVSLGVDEGQKIGLIGVNGTGKSTFLKVVAGIEPADAGKIIWGSNVRVGYLPQNPDFNVDSTVLAQVFAGDSPVLRLIQEYETALDQAQRHPANAQRQQQLIRLSQQMDAQNAWQLESDAKTILSKLGIIDFAAPVRSLSGGQRKQRE